MNEYKNPVCRGCPTIGNNCGKCERCAQNRMKNDQRIKLTKKSETPTEPLKVPLGKITFECTLNGTVEVLVTTDGKNVIMETHMNLKSGAMTLDENKNARFEQSPVFTLFTTMMQAQKDKG